MIVTSNIKAFVQSTSLHQFVKKEENIYEIGV